MARQRLPVKEKRPIRDPVWEQWVKNLKGALPKRALSEEIRGVNALSKWLTSDRSKRPFDYMNNRRAQESYLRYFWPRQSYLVHSLAKRIDQESLILQQLQHQSQQSGVPPNILDVGAGPLSASVALMKLFRDGANFHAIDRSLSMMEMARRNLKTLPWYQGRDIHSFELQKSDFRRFRTQKRFDIIVFGHVLNEALERETINTLSRFLVQYLRLLKPGGLLLITEPATRGASQSLSKLRDLIVDDDFCDAIGMAPQIISPCPKRVQICPYLDTFNGWCFQTFPWGKIAPLSKLREGLGFDDTLLKVSHLALRRAHANEKSVDGVLIDDQSERKRIEGDNTSSVVARIVSGKMHVRSKVHRYLCSDEGAFDFELADPHHALAKAPRGAGITIHEWETL